ncbi:HNH endonuclease signature motif containing protein [Vibrio tapetis]|uniref:HNH nuclease domain-containing protein n=1 Tax=Vibrio tapetis subsp. tapetis TaxID=1671868 RepID=A0A2N8ZID5_9VIBR|nr:HNH endonuclease signature motif containing protein [Vibrio tapetis]SON51670.1 protein of unknown function [Vibrio tapetis subsp. tapetis]
MTSNSEKLKGDAKPKVNTTTTTNYARSPEVKAWALNRANGVCEYCDNPAPFETEEDRPFLEVHHIVPLVDGGANTVENCADICPNCHRMLHFGRGREDKANWLLTNKENHKVYNKVSTLNTSNYFACRTRSVNIVAYCNFQAFCYV